MEVLHDAFRTHPCIVLNPSHQPLVLSSLFLATFSVSLRLVLVCSVYGFFFFSGGFLIYGLYPIYRLSNGLILCVCFPHCGFFAFKNRFPWPLSPFIFAASCPFRASTTTLSQLVLGYAVEGQYLDVLALSLSSFLVHYFFLFVWINSSCSFCVFSLCLSFFSFSHFFLPSLSCLATMSRLAYDQSETNLPCAERYTCSRACVLPGGSFSFVFCLLLLPYVRGSRAGVSEFARHSGHQR